MAERTEAELMVWIDGASYADLLEKWRFGDVGDALFQGAIGRHYARVLFQKRDAAGHEAAVQASKAVGWGEGA